MQNAIYFNYLEHSSPTSKCPKAACPNRQHQWGSWASQTTYYMDSHHCMPSPTPTLLQQPCVDTPPAPLQYTAQLPTWVLFHYCIVQSWPHPEHPALCLATLCCTTPRQMQNTEAKGGKGSLGTLTTIAPKQPGQWRLGRRAHNIIRHGLPVGKPGFWTSEFQDFYWASQIWCINLLLKGKQHFWMTANIFIIFKTNLFSGNLKYSTKKCRIHFSTLSSERFLEAMTTLP